MAHVQDVEVEPPMHLQRPSSGRSQDVSHILAGVFRELFSRDVVGEETVRHLSVSRSGDAGYHDKYVEQLRNIQEERERRHREADMLEAHIMQAQAAATAADERELQRSSEGYDKYDSLGLPPAQSNLRFHLDTQLLKKFNLIVPEDFISERHSLARPPHGDELPSYARPTTSSQQRFRKTPPLTDYLDEEGTPWTLPTPSVTSEKTNYDLPQTSKSKCSKSTSWRESMKPDQRQVEREDLKRLQKKSEYKRNPRFVPPLTADLIKPSKDKNKTKSKHKNKGTEEKKAEAPVPVEVFITSPNPLVFTEYKVGQVYELILELKNVTSSSRQVRIVPPATKFFSAGLGRFPGGSGVVAPGMSCQYPIKFAPDSLADYDDIIKIKTQVDPPLVISLQARRPPPVLSISPTLSCGHTLVGDRKRVSIPCKNTGGPGRFCVMPKADWPVTSSRWSLDDPGSVTVPPFELRPAMCQLDAGETIMLEVTFCPTAATFFQQDIVMLCDNCHVKEFSLEGTGQMAGIEFVSVSGGLSAPDVGEILDSDAEYLVKFSEQNPSTKADRTLLIRNTTNVALPFRWKLCKPCLRCPRDTTAEVHRTASLSRVRRTGDESGVFSVTPNMGILPAHQTADFSLVFAPIQVGSYHNVGHLVLEEIPVHDGSARDHSVRDVTALEIELKAESKPFQVSVHPASLSIPGTLMLDTQYTYPVQITNTSVSSVEFSWDSFAGSRGIVSLEPASGVLSAGETLGLRLTLSGRQPGSLEQTLYCHVTHSAAPVYLHVKAAFEGPAVDIGLPDVNFGLVRLGESCTREVPLVNSADIPVTWTISECIDYCMDRTLPASTPEFVFSPSSGELAARGRRVVSVTFTPSEARRMRSVFQCDVTNGKSRFVSALAEVQAPLACLQSCGLRIDEVYMGVPVTCQVTLQNQTLLDTAFHWRELVDNDYSVGFEPSSGVLQPREALPINVTVNALKEGPMRNLAARCDVTGMPESPLWLDITAEVRGLSVRYQTPTLEELARSDLTQENPGSELLLDFETVSLGCTSRTVVVLTNTSAIRAAFTVEVEHFKANRPPTPPPGPPSNKNRRPPGLLGRTPNLADPLSKTSNKAHGDYCRAVLRDGRGVAFVPSPATGELQPFGSQIIEVTAYSDMWGEYRDNIICKVAGLVPVRIPIRMSVVGCPLNFQMTKDQPPILRLGTHVSGAPPIRRSLRINNTSPLDIRLDWESYNIVPDDVKLLDMLVFIGEPLPIMKDGAEVIPPAEEAEGSAADEPFIRVKLREHEGHRADKPFSVAPAQQVIPARGHASVGVTFTPHTDSAAGQSCLAYAAAYLSLDSKSADVPLRVSRTRGTDLAPFRLDMTANVDPAMLSVEMEEDKGSHFAAAASDLFGGERTKIHRFVLNNTTKTPLSLKVNVQAPFQLISTEPPPSAKSGRSQSADMVTVKPAKNLEVRVGFCLTEELLERVAWAPERHVDSHVGVGEAGERTLQFATDLKISFSNNTTQTIPLTASVAVPTLRLSSGVLNFGMCFVGQQREMSVTLVNPSLSSSTWAVVKDLRYPQISLDAFNITPSEGFLQANISHVADNKTTLKVTFVAKHNIEYECALLFSGRLKEEEQRLVVRGRGSYDGRHEQLVNVLTDV